MKSYYRFKGRYGKGEVRKVVIEYQKGKKIKTITLPKPERMMEILGRIKNNQNIKEKVDGLNPCTLGTQSEQKKGGA